MPFTERPVFYLVWCSTTGFTRCRHKSREDAEKEAQRLADEHGRKFHVLMSLGRCTADKVKNKEVKEEEKEVKRTTIILKKKKIVLV